MYRVDNNKIGTYLGKIISAKYGKDRQFAIAYLKLRDNTSNPAPDEIQKMANKICQIKNGNKGIQITDLPIFSELLNVSVDDILSGGTSCRPVANRLSNYSIAFSKDKKEWEDYIHRPDKLILNPDEYGKTVLDYAIEFKNYEFLKYLMDNKYIWFVGEDKNEYWIGFGAGTNIERRTPLEYDIAGIKMKERDDLRTSLIALAIENKDFDVLDELKAREIPALYHAGYMVYNALDFDKYYNEDMLEAVSRGPEKVLLYFSEEFEISTNLNCSFTFTYPFLGELLDLVVKRHSKAAPKMLKNALKHNKSVLKKIKEIEEISTTALSEFSKYYSKEDLLKQAKEYFAFFEENDTVRYNTGYLTKDHFDGIFSNIIYVDAASNDEYVQSLIADVNEIYEEIASYKEKEA